MGKLAKIRADLKSITPRERFFFICAMVALFLVGVDYAIVRPVANSLFTYTYGAKLLPYAWLATVPLNLLVVGLYNWFLQRIGSLHVFGVSCAVVAVLNLASVFLLKSWGAWPFFYYVWKEIYIMLMLQQIWSIIHATVPLNRAKLLYGVIFTSCGLGGVVGACLPSSLAVGMGTENLLFLSVPIYASLTAAYVYLCRTGDVRYEAKEAKERRNLLQDLKLFVTSPFLKWILLIVLFMQLASSILEFQFNTYLETEIPEKDLRTAYWGRMVGIVQTATIILQSFGSMLFIHVFGLRWSHLLIPFFLAGNAVGFLLLPGFTVIGLSYASLKTLDFSIFSIVKEMLYIPLGMEEKFRGKALVDIFAFRTSKALGSCLILGLSLLFTTQELMPILTVTSLALFALWIFSVRVMFKRGAALLEGATPKAEVTSH